MYTPWVRTQTHLHTKRWRIDKIFKFSFFSVIKLFLCDSIIKYGDENKKKKNNNNDQMAESKKWKKAVWHIKQSLWWQKKMEWKSTKIRHYYCQLMVGVLSIWDSVRIAVPSSPTGQTTEPEPGCKNIFHPLPLLAEKAYWWMANTPIYLSFMLMVMWRPTNGPITDSVTFWLNNLLVCFERTCHTNNRPDRDLHQICHSTKDFPAQQRSVAPIHRDGSWWSWVSVWKILPQVWGGDRIVECKILMDKFCMSLALSSCQVLAPCAGWFVVSTVVGPIWNCIRKFPTQSF
jgi:hypothetical protein